MNAVTVEDLSHERQGLEAWRREQGLETSDDDFRHSLNEISLEPRASPMKREKAASLLALLKAVQRTGEIEDYQRLLFAGNTTNEVSVNHLEGLYLCMM